MKVPREKSILFKLFAQALLCVFLLTAQLSFAQEDRTLQQIQALPDDTGKVTALNTFAYDLSFDNYDSAFLISQQALQLARELNWEEGTGRSLHFLGLFSSFKSDNRVALEFYEQALDIWLILESSSDEKDRKRILEHKGKTLGNMGIVYMDLGDYPHALDYYFEALKLAKPTVIQPMRPRA